MQLGGLLRPLPNMHWEKDRFPGSFTFAATGTNVAGVVDVSACEDVEAKRTSVRRMFNRFLIADTMSTVRNIVEGDSLYEASTDTLHPWAVAAGLPVEFEDTVWEIMHCVPTSETVTHPNACDARVAAIEYESERGTTVALATTATPIRGSRCRMRGVSWYVVRTAMPPPVSLAGHSHLYILVRDHVTPGTRAIGALFPHLKMVYASMLTEVRAQKEIAAIDGRPFTYAPDHGLRVLPGDYVIPWDNFQMVNTFHQAHVPTLAMAARITRHLMATQHVPLGIDLVDADERGYTAGEVCAMVVHGVLAGSKHSS